MCSVCKSCGCSWFIPSICLPFRRHVVTAHQATPFPTLHPSRTSLRPPRAGPCRIRWTCSLRGRRLPPRCNGESCTRALRWPSRGTQSTDKHTHGSARNLRRFTEETPGVEDKKFHVQAKKKGGRSNMSFTDSARRIEEANEHDKSKVVMRRRTR